MVAAGQLAIAFGSTVGGLLFDMPGYLSTFAISGLAAGCYGFCSLDIPFAHFWQCERLVVLRSLGSLRGMTPTGLEPRTRTVTPTG